MTPEPRAPQIARRRAATRLVALVRLVLVLLACLLGITVTHAPMIAQARTHEPEHRASGTSPPAFAIAWTEGSLISPGRALPLPAAPKSPRDPAALPSLPPYSELPPGIPAGPPPAPVLEPPSPAQPYPHRGISGTLPCHQKSSVDAEPALWEDGSTVQCSTGRVGQSGMPRSPGREPRTARPGRISRAGAVTRVGGEPPKPEHPHGLPHDGPTPLTQSEGAMPKCIYCSNEFTPEGPGQDACSVRCTRAYVLSQRRNRPDLIVEDAGSVVILRGMTDAGYDWIEENVSAEGYQPFGLGARLCEPRYVADVLTGAAGDGLAVEVRR